MKIGAAKWMRTIPVFEYELHGKTRVFTGAYDKRHEATGWETF